MKVSRVIDASLTVGAQGPDVLLAGFARSGTTLLARLLAEHPSVAVAGQTPPEPKVLLNWSGRLEDSRNAYAEIYRNAPLGAVRIDKSTSYSDHPHVFALGAQILPQARWVFVVRDPIERILSNYRWSTHNGLETRSLETVLAETDSTDLGLPREPRAHDYLWRSRYGRLLEQWARYVPEELGYVVQFEQLVADPSGTLDGLCAFLGLPERVALPSDLPRINAAPDRFESGKAHLLAPLARGVLAADVELLCDRWPSVDPRMWTTWHALASD